MEDRNGEDDKMGCLSDPSREGRAFITLGDFPPLLPRSHFCLSDGRFAISRRDNAISRPESQPRKNRPNAPERCQSLQKAQTAC